MTRERVCAVDTEDWRTVNRWLSLLGGVNTIDPATGRSFDDNRRFIDAIAWLTEGDRKKIFEENARKAYPRLGAYALNA
jgi:hypothetical protein